MSSLSRRAFVAQAAALLPAAKLAAGMDKLTQNNLGVQLYTVRNIIGSSPEGILKQIKEIGYSEVEATADTLAKDWSAIQSSGLKALSAHLNLDPTDAQLADVKSKGFEYAVIPYVPPPQRGGLDVMKKMAASFQKAGERAKSHGLQLCYHNHAFEFEPMGGTTPLEVIMGETKPEDLKLEMDIFWVTVAGHDPVELLKKYSGRVPLLHLKDKKKGQPAQAQYNENVPKDTFKEDGNGSIDIPSVLKAADAAGALHYFVEQDQTPNPILSLRQSYKYLSAQFG
ncbi:MAG: Xylose isomerase domain protein barrel [Bryobacterales bacterium]|jgi:sugar phosphate isomerase/epimerase|nr:Xylose isomerase domain protein barrel [Bryobacterales bacterium]